MKMRAGAVLILRRSRKVGTCKSTRTRRANNLKSKVNKSKRHRKRALNVRLARACQAIKTYPVASASETPCPAGFTIKLTCQLTAALFQFPLPLLPTPRGRHPPARQHNFRRFHMRGACPFVSGEASGCCLNIITSAQSIRGPSPQRPRPAVRSLQAGERSICGLMRGEEPPCAALGRKSS